MSLMGILSMNQHTDRSGTWMGTFQGINSLHLFYLSCNRCYFQHMIHLECTLDPYWTYSCTLQSSLPWHCCHLCNLVAVSRNSLCNYTSPACMKDIQSHSYSCSCRVRMYHQSIGIEHRLRMKVAGERAVGALPQGRDCSRLKRLLLKGDTS